MIVSIVLATVYGAWQLWILATPTRTIRLRTVVLGVMSGTVVTLPLAVLFEWAWTRLAMRFSDSHKFEVVTFAGWTVDPFIEEIVRLFPLVLLVATVRACRRQWSFSDLVVFGAAVGAGYRVGEHFARFPSAPRGAMDSLSDGGGWVFAGVTNIIYAPPPQKWLFQWCPDGIQSLAGLQLAPGENFNVLLIWGTLGGLAVAMWAFGQRRLASYTWAKGVPWSACAVVLVLLAALSHAAVNASYSSAEWPLGILTIPHWLTGAVGWWPVVALGGAMLLDAAILRKSKSTAPTVLLNGHNERSMLFALAKQDLPVSAFSVLEYLRLRRIYLYARSTSADPPVESDAAPSDLADAVTTMTARLLWAMSGGPLWSAVRSERKRARRQRVRALFRFPTVVLLVLSLACAILPLLYLVIGGTQSMGAVQDWFVTHPWMAWLPVVISMVVGGLTLVVLLWRWPKIPRSVAEFRTTAVLAILNQTAALVFAAFLLYLYRSGHWLRLPLINNMVHGLDAFGSLLLVMGLVVLALALSATGGIVLVGGVALLTAGETLAIGGAMSLSGLALLLAGSTELPQFELDLDTPPDLPPPPIGRAGAVAVGGAIAVAVHQVQQMTSDGASAPMPPPEQGWSYDPSTQYRDNNGHVRWKDTGQLVSDAPNRTDVVPDSSKSPAPPGFVNGETFLDFGDALQAGLRDAGIDDATLYLQGSAVTNQRHGSGDPFGPDSDYDVLIVSDKLAQRARAAGIDFRNNGVSQPIDDSDLYEPIGLQDLEYDLLRRFQHETHLRIVASGDVQGGPSGVYIPSRAG